MSVTDIYECLNTPAAGIPMHAQALIDIHLDRNARILIVDDDVDFMEPLRRKLEHFGHVVDLATDLSGARANLGKSYYHVVLLDVMLGSQNAIGSLNDVVRVAPFTQIIMMTAHGSIPLVVEAMQQGASGFLTKDRDFESIAREVHELASARVSEVDANSSNNLSELGLIGNSLAIRRVGDVIERVKDSSATVLICGESGTGKEVVARALHSRSSRARARFAAINCGAIPEPLLESELFGHKRGAFTDAKTDRKGFFEICTEGTLLLDEIGDMPISLQVKLLRVLQEQEFTPVGSCHPIKVDTRVVAATNRNLAEEVKAGRFREDLFYRLAVLYIQIPPLRDRRDDIPALTQHFVDHFSRVLGKEMRPTSDAVIARLRTYEWPGNIRELRNSIERAVVLSQDGHLHVEDIFSTITPAINRLLVPTANNLPDDQLVDMPLRDARLDFERRYLETLLRKTGGNISEAARIAGQYRPNFYRLIEKHHIKVQRGREAQA